MLFGLRVIKTGLAIGLSMAIASALGNEAFIYAGLIAMFAVQPSIYRSYVTMFDQFKGNIVGAIIATSIVLLFGNSFVMVSIAAILTISSCVKLNVMDKVPALVTVVAIMENNTSEYSTIEFAFIRFAAVTIGFFTAFFINLFLFPPKHEKRLLTQIHELNEKIRDITKQYLQKKYSYENLQQELHQLEKPFKSLYALYDFYHEEKQLIKQKNRARYRKVVFIKQLILTTNLGYKMLQKIKNHEHDLHQMPCSLQNILEAHILNLQNYHEKLLHQCTKDKENDFSSSYEKILEKEQEQVVSEYMQIAHPSNNKNWVHLMELISLLNEYKEQLFHLEQIIHSYYTYHHDKKPIYLPKNT